MFFGHFLATKKFHKPLYKIDNENTVVSVSVSVSAETENHFRFRYRFRQKRNMAISARFGFGRNKKKPFGRALIKTVVWRIIFAQPFISQCICHSSNYHNALSSWRWNHCRTIKVLYRKFGS